MSLRETKFDSFLRVLCKPTISTKKGHVRVVRQLECGMVWIVVLTKLWVWMVNHTREADCHFVEEVVPGSQLETLKKYSSQPYM